MRKTLLYILGISAAMLTSCSDDVIDSSAFLNGKEKTPIAVSLNFDDKQPATRATSRAVNGAFEANDTYKDQLVAYFRHVMTNDATTNPVVYSVVKSGKEGTPDQVRLVHFEVSALTQDHHNIANNYDQSAASTLTCTDTQGLYWDDFSEGGKGDPTDIRTDNHALQSYYGYCYNGGTPSIALGADENHKTEDGKIKWTVATNQSSTNASDPNAFQHSDLLFSPTQTPVAYIHGTDNTITGRGCVLNIPYTHAMSMVTVEVLCEDGFLSTADNFSNAQIIINSANTVCSVTAPTATVAPGTPAEVTMQKGTSTNDYKKCVFSAIIAPSLVKADEVAPFITIKNIDDNDYKVYLTDAIIDEKVTDSEETKEKAWSKYLAISTATSLTPNTEAGYTKENGGMMIPGVNYYITVTLKKQAVKVNASIRKWSEASAKAEGAIDIPNGNEDYYIKDDPAAAGDPIAVKTIDKDKFQGNSEFSLFTVKHGTETDDVSERIDDKYSYATICKFVDNTGEDEEDYWVNTPEIYWPNKTDNYYFRALAAYKGKNTSSAFITEKVGTYNSDKGLSVSQGTIEAGKDIIWANTPRHIGKVTGSDAETVYDIGKPIPPRKGGVPLAFQHAMTKVTFNLVDKNKDATVDGWETDDTKYQDYDNPLNPRINLAGAKIQITNLSTTGTIAIEDGKVTATEYTSGCKVFGDGTGYNPALLNGTANAITDELLKEFIMVPQTISDAAMLTVTLADGTSYKVQLNMCLDASDSAIREWEQGKHYTYTITLEKEKITFRAMIKDWEPVEGGGKATLEWD